MAHLAIKLCLFAIPLLVVSTWLEWGMRLRPDTLQRKRQCWEAAADSTRILILGSSHAQFGLRPDALREPAFNLAGFSQTLRYDSALLALSIARMPRLETVILTVSYFTLQEELGAGVEPWRCWSYLESWGIPAPASLHGYDPQRWSRALRLGNWRTAMQALKGFPPMTDLVAIGPDGWGIAFAPHPNQPQDSVWARARIQSWRASMDTSRRAEQVRRLGHILAMASASHLKVALVTTPVLEPLRRMESWATRRENLRFFDSLATLHGAQRMDFEADPSFVDSDFVDMDHLGPQAARRFTQRVGIRLGIPVRP